MNVFGIGLPEMALIFVVALLIFELQKAAGDRSEFGKAIRSFQDASNEFQSEFKREARTNRTGNADNCRTRTKANSASSKRRNRFYQYDNFFNAAKLDK